MKSPIHITIKKVVVLGCPVGNVWDVYFNHRWVGRVSYHGNALVCIKGVVGQRNRVEKLINDLYTRPETTMAKEIE